MKYRRKKTASYDNACHPTMVASIKWRPQSQQGLWCRSRPCAGKLILIQLCCSVYWRWPYLVAPKTWWLNPLTAQAPPLARHTATFRQGFLWRGGPSFSKNQPHRQYKARSRILMAAHLRQNSVFTLSLFLLWHSLLWLWSMRETEHLTWKMYSRRLKKLGFWKTVEFFFFFSS